MAGAQDKTPQSRQNTASLYMFLERVLRRTQGNGNNKTGKNNPHQCSQYSKPLGQPFARMEITVPHGNGRDE